MQVVKRVKRSSAAMIVRRDLIRLIKEGYFSDGMLPSEDGIATMLGVSRITVRDALANLDNLGYISRIQGKGTIINQTISSMTGRVSEGQPFTELIRSQGFTPSVSHGKVEKCPMDPDIGEKLQTKSDEMYRIEKLFLGDGQPMIFSINFFPTDYLNDNIFSYPMDGTLIFTILQNHFDFPEIAYDIVNICPYAADAHVASLLELPVNTAILMFEAISMDSHQTPLLINREYYHPEKMRFREVRTANYTIN